MQRFDSEHDNESQGPKHCSDQQGTTFILPNTAQISKEQLLYYYSTNLRQNE